MSEPIIEVQGLVKRFGPIEVLNHLNFTLQEGESVGLLGENGAGKTTTMRILAGFLPPSSGTVRLAGFDAVFESLQLRKNIGYLPESVPLYPNMRVEEYVRFRGRLKGVNAKQIRISVEEALDRVGLMKRSRSLIRTLSKGLRQRVGIADAIVHKPRILILDEPTSGLDPSQRVEVRQLIGDLAGEHTILVSSHILPEVETTCQRVIVLSEGCVVAQDTIEELRRTSEIHTIDLVVRGDAQAAIKALSNIENASIGTPLSAGDDLASIPIDFESADIPRQEILKLLLEHEVEVHELKTPEQSLESALLKLMKGGEDST